MKAKHRLQRRIALSLVLLASMSIALEHGFTSDQVKVELINIENALAAAVVDSDIAVLDSTYAEDFVFTHSDGRVDTKENWLNDLRNNDQIYVSRSIDSIEVELHGDIAITTGRIHIKTELDDPRRRQFTICYVRVYERRDQRWQLLSHRTIRNEPGPLTNEFRCQM